jgi:hypothetical protein
MCVQGRSSRGNPYPTFNPAGLHEFVDLHTAERWQKLKHHRHEAALE